MLNLARPEAPLLQDLDRAIDFSEAALQPAANRFEHLRRSETIDRPKKLDDLGAFLGFELEAPAPVLFQVDFSIHAFERSLSVGFYGCTAVLASKREERE